MPSLPFLICPLELRLKKHFSSVKISDLPPSEDSNLLLSLQLETEDPGVKSNKRKKTELYCNLLHLNDTNDMEVLGFWILNVILTMSLFTILLLVQVRNPEGLVIFTATHTNQPKISIRASKPIKKSSMVSLGGGLGIFRCTKKPPQSIFTFSS